MPEAPRKPCPSPTCRHLQPCPVHGLRTHWGAWTSDPWYHTPAWRKLRLSILKRDRYTCQACGRYAEAVDHITPKTQGGAWDDPSNLQALCGLHYGTKTPRAGRIRR